MGYQRLEEQGHISSNLCTAVEIEENISDLLHDGFSCDSSDIQRCYQEARELSYILNDYEKLVVSAVGKKLWRDRLGCYSDPADSPEYSPNVDSEIAEYDQRIHDLPHQTQRQVAREVINSVSLPVLPQSLSA